jgi:hypothetical protein
MHSLLRKKSFRFVHQSDHCDSQNFFKRCIIIFYIYNRKGYNINFSLGVLVDLIYCGLQYWHCNDPNYIYFLHLIEHF